MTEAITVDAAPAAAPGRTASADHRRALVAVHRAGRQRGLAGREAARHARRARELA
jgi:hypothetical protein